MSGSHSPCTVCATTRQFFTKATAFSVENKARYLTKLVEGQSSMEAQAGASIQTYAVITL